MHISYKKLYTYKNFRKNILVHKMVRISLNKTFAMNFNDNHNQNWPKKRTKKRKTKPFAATDLMTHFHFQLPICSNELSARKPSQRHRDTQIKSMPDGFLVARTSGPASEFNLR